MNLGSLESYPSRCTTSMKKWSVFDSVLDSIYAQVNLSSYYKYIVYIFLMFRVVFSCCLTSARLGR